MGDPVGSIKVGTGDEVGAFSAGSGRSQCSLPHTLWSPSSAGAVGAHVVALSSFNAVRGAGLRAQEKS